MLTRLAVKCVCIFLVHPTGTHRRNSLLPCSSNRLTRLRSFRRQPTCLFFESIDSVDILPEQVALGFVQEFSGTAYRLITNGDTTTYAALFANESQANNAAEEVRRAARICHARPVVVNAAAGAPLLPETLRYIADQLNAQGTAGWRIGNAAGGADVALRLSQVVPDTTTCQIRYNRTFHASAIPGVTREINDVDKRMGLSFRRMEKVQVVPEGQSGTLSFRRMEKVQVVPEGQSGTPVY